LTNQTNRLRYLDWLRGLAAAVMLQGHVFEGWVRPQDRSSEWFWLSQFLGGLPAPMFLFLVGVSLALVLDRMRQKRATPMAMLQKVVRRAGWILLVAYAFRLEQFLVWYPFSRWQDIFRVDTLNCIAASSLVIGLFSAMFKTRRANMIATALAAAAVTFLTPFVYPVRADISPFLLSYLNGNGDSSYFSLFPWITFAFVGIAFGYALLQARDAGEEPRFFLGVAVAGICSYVIGSAMALTPVFEYGFYDYSLTSPHFVFIRLGLLALILYGAYRWSTRSNASSWSPLCTMGQASLLVYWIHIDLVYGRPFSLFGRSMAISEAAAQLLWIVPFMVALAWIRQYGFLKILGIGALACRRAISFAR
jgi:uncharacterized membrane protein